MANLKEQESTQSLIEKLLRKSQEAFIVGVELYNKPTIHYRVEGFSFFICNAWELLLKAYLIKNEGETSIYYSKENERTISLFNCVERIFTNNKDPLRMNLERILELRNTSTHFITEEYEQIYVPFFQSSILNYTNKLLEFFGIDITEKISANFLMLSIKLSTIDPNEIRARYSKPIANKLLHTVQKINESIPEKGNDRYAVLIRHDFYITKKKDLATTSISITSDASKAAYILKEIKDMQKTCPYQRKKCIELINKRIKKDNINFINPLKPAEDEKRHNFNTSHFDLIVKFYQIKNNPKYCYKYDRSSQTLFTYSDSAIEFIISEIKKDPENIIRNLKNKQKKS
ncbi:DUF3644 domain-containing protein [Dialister micraerophilus]|uniref:DUF3644 domain-containing protein n=1 Tax=Dialister micraerophilus TaxID=309120 RepID=UPI0023F00A50|nr:DUF3644 domain-containing protein [Dialister micraerophilus]